MTKGIPAGDVVKMQAIDAGKSRPWRSQVLAVLLSMSAAFAAVLLVFDWTWLRPLIQHHVWEHSGRTIDFDSMRVTLDAAFRPTLHLRGVQVQNAAWAADRPLLRAGTFDLTFGWESLRADKWIITRMVLIDAELELERQADGLRNWRLTRPDDRGPGRIRVLSVDAQSTSVRFVDRGLKLELNLQTEALSASEVAGVDSTRALTKTMRIQGERNGTGFEGRLATSDVVTFFETGENFALRGAISTPGARLVVDGVAHDLLALGGFDAKVSVDGTRPHELVRVFGGESFGEFAQTPVKTSMTARVYKQGTHWNVTALKAKVGLSDVAGTATLQREGADTPASVRASLQSAHLDFVQLSRFRRVAQPAAGDSADQSARQMNAVLDWEVQKVSGLASVPIESVRLTASIREDRVKVSSLTFNVAGGRVSGTLDADRTKVPTAVALDATLSGIDLTRFGDLPVDGELHLRVALHSRGDSMAMLTSSASGTLKAELVRATVPAKLDAQVGLNGGRWLRTFFNRDERVPITCSALDLRIERGKGQIRQLTFETGSVWVRGVGSVDLLDRSFDLLLFPHRKQVALLALDRAIRLQGSSAKLVTTLVDREPAISAEPCVPGPRG